jgi:hypothetical protein
MIRFARSSSDEWLVIRPSHSYFLGYFWHINQFSYVFWPFLDHGTNKIWIFSPGSPRRPCFWTSWAVRQRMWFFSYSWFDGTVMDYTILIILYDFYMIISRLYIYIHYIFWYLMHEFRSSLYFEWDIIFHHWFSTTFPSSPWLDMDVTFPSCPASG